MTIFANGQVLVKTSQIYLFTVMKHHAHSRSVGLEDCYNSNSQKISQLETTSLNCMEVECGKLQSKRVIQIAKEKCQKVMGNMQIGRTGLGYIKRRKIFNDEKQQNCRQFLEVIRKAESESLFTKAVQRSVQGQWSKWQGYIKRDMTWHNPLK